MSPEAAVREIDIEELYEQADGAFASWGYSRLKVTKGDEVLAVLVRIGSVPQDLVDALRRKAPRPPVKTVMLDPNTEDGRALGVTTRQKAQVPDFGDPAYVEALQQHQQMFTREIVGRGVTSKLRFKDGRTAEAPEERYAALEEHGLSGPHFLQLTDDILNLTQWTEVERANFLGRGSASSTAGRSSRSS